MYPLMFRPIYKDKVWGGRTLEKHFGRALPKDAAGGTSGLDAQIGESWELVDLGTTMASGGGGGSERSVVADGPLAGLSLSELIRASGRSLLGDLPLTESGEFPLLVKYLDARENLSLQVHPSPEYAAKHDDAFLKSEAWYVVAAEPDGCIYKGLTPGTDPATFRAALEKNDVEALKPLLCRVPVKAGDCHYLPSGTCHALAAGVLVAEVQTPSDTTFRVFDWGREGRTLHVEEAMACIDFVNPPPSFDQPELSNKGMRRRNMVNCPFFFWERIEVEHPLTTTLNVGQPEVLMFIEGSATVSDPVAGDRKLAPGTTMLIPPGLEEASMATAGAATWLRVSFPAAKQAMLA